MLTFVLPAVAYEQTTHQDLSERAAKASVLKETNGVLKDLGLKGLLDPSQTFPNSNGDSRILLDLIKDGANFEDGFNDCESRPRNHFFDPKYDRPLTVFGLNFGEKSPDWALEDKSIVTGQQYSFHYVREYFYKALTRPVEDERNKFFGLTFQTLGHVIHHLQDMAQPQHVRNDVHLSISENCWYKAIAKIAENPSLYEFYTKAHPGELSLGGAAVQFPNPRDFWTNDAGTGLAQFTNRNFVSAGTNFELNEGKPSANSIYPQPEPVAGSESSVGIQQLFADANLPPPRDQNGNLLQGDVVFIGSYVDGVLNERASTLSLFDQDLRAYHKTVSYDADPFDPTSTGQVTVDRLFTLNQFNFRAAYPFLIPKAVGYSAGMINYFFRGAMDMDIDYDSTTVGQYLIRNQGQEDMQGSFTLYYDAVDGKRYPVAGDATEITWKDVTVPQNGRSPSLIPPVLPSNPKPKRLDEYFLVFKGQMGEEKPLDAQSVGAVVVKNKLRLLWEPWRLGLTDDHAWTSGAGSVNGIVGPNSQTLQNGWLVEYAGVGGAGWLVWQAAGAEDYITGRYMRIRLNCSQSAATENWDVYGYLSVGPGLFSSQTIPFAGGAGNYDSSPYKLMPRPTETKEYIIDLGGLGIQVGYIEITTIGFDMELTCSADYIDFSDKPFEKVPPEAIYIP